jgi:hypothetical protein
MLEFFGWFRAATAADQTSLIVLTVICAVLGIFLYMNEQGRQTFGSGGPGSKFIMIALMLAVFTGCFTMVSSFSILPEGHPSTISGTCASGFACDQYNNIDFQTTSSQFGQNGGLGGDAVSAIAALPGAILSLILLVLKICAGIFLFPVILNGIMNGLYPGISSNAMWIVFLGVMEVAFFAVYALGVLELIRGSPGSTI